MILLNALATKLQRDHYAESWKASGSPGPELEGLEKGV